ncbi:MAG: hypothetical protein IAF38_23115 [Bacteroidia bacterium]|nr:hypothetical protein [Bacteroidia bacterium]
MPIKRCSDQKRQTLEEFYSEWASSESDTSSGIGKCMLSIIEFINVTFKETQIYGLTSHAHLLLRPIDNWTEVDWFVAFVSNGKDFHIEYRVPKNKQSWENAKVTGEAKSFEKFKKFLIIAMTESEGWTESQELKKLYLKWKTQSE